MFSAQCGGCNLVDGSLVVYDVTLIYLFFSVMFDDKVTTQRLTFDHVTVNENASGWNAVYHLGRRDSSIVQSFGFPVVKLDLASMERK